MLIKRLGRSDPEVDGGFGKRGVAGEEAGKKLVGAPPEEENFEFLSISIFSSRSRYWAYRFFFESDL